MLVAELIAIVNMMFAFASMFVLLWATPQVGRPLNIILCVAAGLAFFYGLSYIWLVFNIAEGAAWSSVLRWVSLITWPVVWMAPALAMVRYKNLAGAMIRKASRPDNVITDIPGMDTQKILNRDDYS